MTSKPLAKNCNHATIKWQRPQYTPCFPLGDNNSRITEIFGKAQIDYKKGGDGAGDTIVSYVRNIYQGLKLKSDYLKVFDPLSFYYQTYVEQKR